MSPGDVESASPNNTEFEDDSMRRKFIKKVYMILAAQLLLTLGLVSFFVTSDAFLDYVEENPFLLLVAMVVLFVTMIILACCSIVRRKAPMNYMCLAIFTFAQSFLLGVIGARYDARSILLTVALTALICIVLSLYAMQTKVDFTMMGGFLLVCLIVGLVFGILMIFFYSDVMMMIYCSLGVVLYSIFLIYDTQLMVGGNHAYSISPDEHIFAALNLYVDIIQIFLCLLHLTGSDN
uniref:Protein lifeguard 1 n=1 Tax=Stomoxys calcitrans TaxID=35570 RepID=A0A1I8PBL0_STOCA